MTTTYDADPNTQTIAAAWASSPLGPPEREVRYGFPDDPAEPAARAAPDEPRSPAKRAMLAAALASGVIGGAVLGVLLFDVGSPSGPAVVEQQPTRSNAVVENSTGAPAPTTIVAPAPRPAQLPGTAVVSTPAVAAPTVTAPPVAAPSETVVVDVPKPGDPSLPPKPEDPQPEPPSVPDLNWKLPEPPKPIPPVLVPDFPKAPAPKPDPQPKPSLPDFTLQAP